MPQKPTRSASTARRTASASSTCSSKRPRDESPVDLPSPRRSKVTTPIPAGGLGEVVAMVRGQRYSAAAREAHGGALPRGAAVVVTGMVGSTLLVQTDGPKEG